MDSNYRRLYNARFVPELYDWYVRELSARVGCRFEFRLAAAIPPDERHGWCVQEKIDYAPVLETPDRAGVKVEIRMMFLRPDDEPKLQLAQNLVRLSRGRMLGVDFNKDFTWVGSSIGLY